MTKSQNTKNEQLTEQWKKGELPEGFYFVSDGAEVTIDYYLCDYWERHFDKSVQHVLAPVPSYEEWQASYNCMLENEVLRLENAQLKELLKECKTPLEVYNEMFGNKEELLTKIDEALK